MFELSRRLIGIYKTNNTTKSKQLVALLCGLSPDPTPGLCIINDDKLQKEKERQKAQRRSQSQQLLQTPQRSQRSPQKQTPMQVGTLTASQM